MSGVKVVHWNPPKVHGRLGRLLVPFFGRVDNFGDLLGPQLVDRIVSSQSLKPPHNTARLLTVGSIMKLARAGDVVWGSGVNGKSVDVEMDCSMLDIRAVRGPLTARWLRERGATVPDVFGDPGLLVSRFWPGVRNVKVDYTIIPNMHDAANFHGNPRSISPFERFSVIRDKILSSDLVIGSSLHGIAVAESYGVPARFIKSVHEPEFKYCDYYLGSGRDEFSIASNVDEALSLGGEHLPSWNPSDLMDAFPSDLFEAT